MTTLVVLVSLAGLFAWLNGGSRSGPKSARYRGRRRHCIWRRGIASLVRFRSFRERAGEGVRREPAGCCLFLAVEN